MMALEIGLITQLTSASAVSTFTSSRVFGAQLPVGCALPAAIVQSITTRDVYSAQGSSNLRFKRVQIDSYAKTYEDSVRLSEAVRSVLKNLNNVTLSDGTVVQGCVIEQDKDMPPEDGDGGFIFRHMIEVTVQHVA